uniref:Membrane associated ring-CH-type finger 4 n=1 Tax=Podarcis muralis TaxID=64176 RepID=A0A670JYS5_PODMU
MLIPTGAIVLWYCCCGLLIPRQMLRHQGLLKCRCRMLFNDLKVFLLRRPPAPPPPSPPPLPPMNSGDQALSLQASNNNTLTTLYGGRRGPWRAPTAGGGGGGGGGGGATSPPEEEWGSPGGEGEQPMSMMSSASSEDFCKGKAEDRYSLGSSLDSGMRTPLCRICFQGPEQVSVCVYAHICLHSPERDFLQSQTFLHLQNSTSIGGALGAWLWVLWCVFSLSILFFLSYPHTLFYSTGLIIHEGPSVYRIFKRWQAVNQQWKVLNYDKTKDLEDQKTGTRTNQRTSSQTNHSSSTGGATSNSAPAESVARGAGHTTGTLSDHHCAYTILHILSHLRPHEQRSHSSTNRELVMRVTTV